MGKRPMPRTERFEKKPCARHMGKAGIKEKNVSKRNMPPDCPRNDQYGGMVPNLAGYDDYRCSFRVDMGSFRIRWFREKRRVIWRPKVLASSHVLLTCPTDTRRVVLSFCRITVKDGTLYVTPCL